MMGRLRILICFLLHVFSFSLLAQEFKADRVLNNIQDIPDQRVVTGIEKTWMFNDENSSWSSAEVSALRQSHPRANVPPRFTLGHPKGDRSKKIIEVTYFDRDSSDGIGRLYIHLNSEEQENQPVFGEEQGDQFVIKSFTRNNVRFSWDEQQDITRHVFIQENTSAKNIRDRLRFGAVGSEVLHPWIRTGNIELWRSMGGEMERRRVPIFDPESRSRTPERFEFREVPKLPLSEPQEGSLRFIRQTYHDGTLGGARGGALVQLPTGMGKTETAFSAYEWMNKQEAQQPNANKRRRMLWVVNSLDVLDQSARRFYSYTQEGEEVFIWNGNTGQSVTAQEKIANGDFDHLFVSQDTLSNPENRELLKKWFDGDDRDVFFVVDEAHGTGAPTRLSSYNWLRAENSNHLSATIFLSATPYHYEEGAIANLVSGNAYYALLNESETDPMTRMPLVPFVSQLVRAMEAGYLSLMLPYTGMDPEFGQDHADDETNSSLLSRRELRVLTDEMRRYGDDIKAMVFHRGGTHENYGSVAQAQQFTEHANSMGLNASLVAASFAGRRETLDQFRATETGVLNVVGVGSQGLDIPDVNMIVFARDSESPNANMQALGRGTRLAQGKTNFFLVDPSGKSFASLFADLDRFFFINPEIAEHVEGVIDEANNDWTIERRERLLKLIGLDPTYVGADPESFRVIVDRIHFSTFLRHQFKINQEKATALNLDLPQPQRGQNLISYFEDNKEVFKQAGLFGPWDEYEIREKVFPLIELKGDLPPKYVGYAWNRAFGEEFQNWEDQRPWPHSSTMNAELRRYAMIHGMVVEHYYEKLRTDPEAEIFFVARDSDDFYRVLYMTIEAFAENEREKQSMLSRIHRLEINHRLIKTDENNRQDLSELPDELLLELLARQGLTPEKVKNGRVTVFDVGYEGRILRPVTGALLQATGMSARAFFRHFNPQLLVRTTDDEPKISSTDPFTALAAYEEESNRRHEASKTRVISQHSRNPFLANLKQLRGYGEFVIDEFPWAEALQQLSESTGVDVDDLAAILEGEDHLLTSHDAREAYIRRFVSGERERRTSLGRDLSRAQRIAKNLKRNADGELVFIRGSAKPRGDLAVRPRTAAVRQQVLCRLLIQATDEMHKQQEGVEPKDSAFVGQ